MFPYELGIFCSSKKLKNFVLEKCAGNLIGIALNLLVAFGSLVIFPILALPTQEHGKYFHLFMSSLISLSIS